MTRTIVLFHVNRWLTLVYAVLIIILYLSPSGTPAVSVLSWSNCAVVVCVYYTLELLLFALWAAFSATRVHVLSGGSLFLSFPVALLSFVPACINAVRSNHRDITEMGYKAHCSL
ncbi:hypothetical protein CERSUDRAFT_105381 [Gelatoporia subvermispora B]|uniref:Uncharacterized protein n=1 Tax=Ceriporiopsis subvermispora (strain B) TaxID=914234 RepID=M2REV9_CERS8|nr:hypothetical protein CERSUDRAFT_105381 [Gelatoporia subvermispora B]